MICNDLVKERAYLGLSLLPNPIHVIWIKYCFKESICGHCYRGSVAVGENVNKLDILDSLQCLPTLFLSILSTLVIGWFFFTVCLARAFVTLENSIVAPLKIMNTLGQSPWAMCLVWQSVLLGNGWKWSLFLLGDKQLILKGGGLAVFKINILAVKHL